MERFYHLISNEKMYSAIALNGLDIVAEFFKYPGLVARISEDSILFGDAIGSSRSIEMLNLFTGPPLNIKGFYMPTLLASACRKGECPEFLAELAKRFTFNAKDADKALYESIGRGFIKNVAVLGNRPFNAKVIKLVHRECRVQCETSPLQTAILNKNADMIRTLICGPFGLTKEFAFEHMIGHALNGCCYEILALIEELFDLTYWDYEKHGYVTRRCELYERGEMEKLKG